MATLLPRFSPGQESDVKKNEPTPARLEEMDRIVRAITLSQDDGSGAAARRAVELRREPLLRWNDSTRGFSNGTLWAWGGAGRPIALTTLEFYHSQPGSLPWSIEMVSLAPGPLEAEGHGGTVGPDATFLRWAPRSPGLEMKPVPNAPKPAPTAPARLRQARELAARFTAEEVNKRATEQRYVLRLLPTPIDRYSQPAAALLDGAMFVFANGTNPEILLLLEARGEPPMTAWSYGTARVTRAAPEVFLDGQMVWTQPYALTAAMGDPYYFVRIAQAPK